MTPFQSWAKVVTADDQGIFSKQRSEYEEDVVFYSFNLYPAILAQANTIKVFATSCSSFLENRNSIKINELF